MKDYFERIIGYEDVKRELRMISDMINHPEVYENMGASVEKGLILYGKPGTGKTTMAECLIESIDRKCFTCRKKSSDGAFVDTIVKTFEEAKANAPSVVFLDDLDKFSEKSEECEAAEEFVTVQTCLDELIDGDVFVVATANNERRFPNSLLRPGRLGKKIKVRIPRKEETARIVKFYLDKVNTNNDLDPESVAMMLEHETCAVLENVIRVSATKAAYNRQECITMDNVVEACLDLVFDAPKLDKSYNEETLKKTAYHESGHALVSELLYPGSVRIASIRPSGVSELGFVRYSRKSDEEFTFEDKVNILQTSLAGKAATEIVFGEPDIGANEDIHHAFDIAERIVDHSCAYGFQNWIQDHHSSFSGENRNRGMAMLMEINYGAVKKLIIQNREKLDKLAEELMNKTTLTHADIMTIMDEVV